MTHTDEIPDQPRLTTWILNPFHYIAGGTALAIGLPIILVASLNASLSNGHFDGVLDFHFGLATPLWFYLLEGVIAWLIVSVVLLAAGWSLSKSRIRLIDVFGTQALARVPMLALPVLAMIPAFQRATAKLSTMQLDLPPADLGFFVVISLLTLALMIWMIVLMYKAFAVSCNVSGGKAIGAFAVALVGAEIFSKLVWVFLLYPLIS